MAELARQFKDILVPTLLGVSAGILTALTFVIAQRVVLKARGRQVVRIRARYVPALRLALAGEAGETRKAVDMLRAASRWHRRVAAEALLEPLRVVQGTTVDRARAIAAELGLLEEWRRGLTHGSWPVQARAALAVGLLRDPEAVPTLVTLLDSDHEEVRAAAVDALGLIGDVAAVAALLPRIGQQARHQQARLVEALRRIGPAGTQSIVTFATDEPTERRLVAELLALVGGLGARETLLEWTTDAEPTVRAAAWRAMGVTGMDDRAVYHALRAMTDVDPRVRAHAAQALGRTGRADFAAHLAQHLDDEWEVAAQGARALSRLGEAGVAALRAREASGLGGHGLELARHFIWEQARP
jgi:HEAT repeat protein